MVFLLLRQNETEEWIYECLTTILTDDLINHIVVVHNRRQKLYRLVEEVNNLFLGKKERQNTEDDDKPSSESIDISSIEETLRVNLERSLDDATIYLSKVNTDIYT